MLAYRDLYLRLQRSTRELLLSLYDSYHVLFLSAYILTVVTAYAIGDPIVVICVGVGLLFGLLRAKKAFGREWFLHRTLVMLVAITIGSIMANMHSLESAEATRRIELLVNKPISLIGRIVDEPKEGSDDVRIRLRSEEYGVDLIIKTSRLPFKEYGMICSSFGSIERPRSDGDFNYARYLSHQGVHGVMDVREMRCSDEKPKKIPIKIRYLLIKMKNHLIDRIEQSMPEPSSSLLAGILFGEDRVFQDQFEESLRVSGTTHIVAASGYNVTILILLVDKLLPFLPRRMRIVVGIGVIWCFTLLSGFSLSVLRATVMLSFVLVGKYLGVVIHLEYIILLMVAVFITVNPGSIFSLSFQLSLSATLGLLYLNPRLFARVVDGGRADGLMKEYLLTTISAILATAPILIYTFGEISLLGILANLFILPVLESTMLMGGLAILFSPVSSTVSQFLFDISWVQLKYFESVVLWLSQFDIWLISFGEYGELSSVLFLLLLLIFLLLRASDEDNFYKRVAKGAMVY